MKTYRPINPSDPIEANIFRAANRSDPYAQYEVLHDEPRKVLPGMFVFADGTDWNPGSGAGPYLRNEANSSWTSLAGTGTSGPVFRAYRATSDQTISSATWTRVTFNTEEFDSDSLFDTSTGRFTPTAGYYIFTWLVNGGETTTATQVGSQLYKNGSAYAWGTWATPVSSDGRSGGSTVTYMNGTDYVEVYGYVQGASPVFRYGSNLTYFSGAYLRAA